MVKLVANNPPNLSSTARILPFEATTGIGVQAEFDSCPVYKEAEPRRDF